MSLNGIPLCIDGYCGLGGWAEGFLAEGWRVIGFDVERHDYGTGGYPGQLVLQNVLTVHGSQCKDADCLVFSPPCVEFSYMAMPWKRAKQIAAALRGHGEVPDGYAGSRTVSQLTALFDACFRIQREAIAAAGRYIPMVVENVKGAQPWVGKAKASFGSFYLWGDVESIGGRVVASRRLQFGVPSTRALKGQKFNPDGTQHGQGSWFKVADSKNRGASKNGHVGGGSWFAIGSPGQTNVGQNPDGRKVPMNFHEYEQTGKPGRSFQSAAVDHTTGPLVDGYKGVDGRSWIRDKSKDPRPSHGTNSPARKAASAQIAKIPLELAQYIARSFRPDAPGLPPRVGPPPEVERPCALGQAAAEGI